MVRAYGYTSFGIVSTEIWMAHGCGSTLSAVAEVLGFYPHIELVLLSMFAAFIYSMFD